VGVLHEKGGRLKIALPYAHAPMACEGLLSPSRAGRMAGNVGICSLLAVNAMPLGIRPINDFAFKKIFGTPENKIALISLLNAILSLPSPIIDVTLLNPFNPQDFQDDKLSVLDIKAVDQNGRSMTSRCNSRSSRDWSRGSFITRVIFSPVK
jgi:hypothetical protein